MFRIPNPFSKRRLTRRQRAERASALAAPTQDVGHVRAMKRRATLNGLYAVAAPEVRERFDAVMSRRAGA
jgi:hypothetical protein